MTFCLYMDRMKENHEQKGSTHELLPLYTYRRRRHRTFTKVFVNLCQKTLPYDRDFPTYTHVNVYGRQIYRRKCYK